MRIPVLFKSTHASAERSVLADSGATDNFINLQLLKRLRISYLAIPNPIKIWNVERTFKQMVPEQYQRHCKIFSKEASHRFPPKRPWDHTIDLIPEAPKTLDCKVYPLTMTEGDALTNFLNEQLKKGYIRPSKSPYASPFFFIKKKDGKLRPVQDYRKLNGLTIKNRYPLPLIPEIIDKVQDARLFTKLDVQWGYNNV